MLQAEKARFQRSQSIGREKNKMRKIITIVLYLFLFLVLPNHARGDMGIGLGAYYYHITDSSYKEIYREGNLMFNSTLSVVFTKKWEGRIEISYFQKKGKSTLKDESVKLVLTPVFAGLRFRIVDTSQVSPYLGAGIDYFLYKEEVPQSFGDDVSDSTIGFHAEAGVYFHMGKNFLLDINFRYVKADAKPFEEKVGIGGLRAGVGLEYRF